MFLNSSTKWKCKAKEAELFKCQSNFGLSLAIPFATLKQPCYSVSFIGLVGIQYSIGQDQF